MGESSKPQISAYYWPFPNFGDMLNETLLRDYFGLNIVREEFTTADIVAVGSVLDKLVTNSEIGPNDKKRQNHTMKDKPMHVWGAGFMFKYPGDVQKCVRPLVVHALRGERSREQLSKIMGENISCTLADPGILAPRLVPADDKKWDVGLVPHYRDKANPVFEKMMKHYSNVTLVDVQQAPETVLKHISQCRTILSTSLHGIIVADSYGIPSCWCECSDQVFGKGFKFHDYYSSFDTDREVYDLLAGKLPDPDKVCRTSFGSFREVKKKQNELLKCFPYTEKNPGTGVLGAIRSLFGRRP